MNISLSFPCAEAERNKVLSVSWKVFQPCCRASSFDRRTLPSLTDALWARTFLPKLGNHPLDSVTFKKKKNQQ